MTPLARALLTDAMQTRNAPLARDLVEATCFDLYAVSGLVEETAHALSGNRHHGGLLFLPSGGAIFELSHGDYRLVFLTKDKATREGVPLEGDNISFSAVAFFSNGKWSKLQHGVLRVDQPETFVIGLSDREGGAIYGLLLAAAIILLNAPYGVERIPQEAHRGFARRVRQRGFGQLRPSITIRLDRAQAPPAQYGAGAGKAFHFCRAHLRRLASGRAVKVRAHWRGDPRLGISPVKPYKVV